MSMNLRESLGWFDLKTLNGLSLPELKNLYHQLAQKYHPDRGGSADDFIKLRLAYTCLQEHLSNPREDIGHDSQENIEQVLSELRRYKSAYTHLQQKVHSYEQMITNQIQLISIFQGNLRAGIEHGKSKDDYLRQILEQELAKLKQEYDSSWWKVHLGIKSMSETEYSHRYNALIDEFNTIKQKQDDGYVDNLLALYRDLINRIVDNINTV